jgi:tripeptidyl-peptidase I
VGQARSCKERYGLAYENRLDAVWTHLLFNIGTGFALTFARSDPYSPKYGQHYTAEEVMELFAPTTDRIDAVREWLHSAGIDPVRISLSPNRQWLQLDTPVDSAEKLFRTKYHIYEHVDSGKMNIACDQ